MKLLIDWEGGESDTLSAAEVYRLIFESSQPWMLSANGTIFTTEYEGIIPGLLKRWYAERKEMQAKKLLKHKMPAIKLKLLFGIKGN